MFIICCVLIILFIINFNRKPPPFTGFTINDIIAPSYGTVYSIERFDDYIHIITFLNPFDVHMQYCPVGGWVKKSIYDRTGNFHLAYKLGKSRLNEKRIHTITSIWGEIAVIQVAGFLTRRVDSWITENQQIDAGQPLGFIHLGSRVDLMLPANGLTLTIKTGDSLIGGRKRIGYYGDPTP